MRLCCAVMWHLKAGEAARAGQYSGPPHRGYLIGCLPGPSSGAPVELWPPHLSNLPTHKIQPTPTVCCLHVAPPRPAGTELRAPQPARPPTCALSYCAKEGPW